MSCTKTKIGVWQHLSHHLFKCLLDTAACLHYLFDPFSLVPWLTVYDGQGNIIYFHSHDVHDRLMFNARSKKEKKFGISVTPKAM